MADAEHASAACKYLHVGELHVAEALIAQRILNLLADL